MGGPLGAGIDRRDLTEPQREQVKAILERHADEMKPIADRVEAARKALNDGIFAKSGDLRGLAMDLGAAEGELALAHAQIQTEVLAVLTPEQLQKVQERRTAMEARRAEMEGRRQGRSPRPGQ
jgi:Spy/CpxP family protein refolding chaperone